MTDQDLETRLRRQAGLQVGVRMSFYIHATVYAIVNAGLAAINVLTTPQTPWFLWPLAGWGIGLFMHGFRACFLLSGGRKRAVEAEITRMRNAANPGDVDRSIGDDQRLEIAPEAVFRKSRGSFSSR